jgi:hypothetical protein
MQAKRTMATKARKTRKKKKTKEELPDARRKHVWPERVKGHEKDRQTFLKYKAK